MSDTMATPPDYLGCCDSEHWFSRYDRYRVYRIARLKTLEGDTSINLLKDATIEWEVIVGEGKTVERTYKAWHTKKLRKSGHKWPIERQRSRDRDREKKIK